MSTKGKSRVTPIRGDKPLDLDVRIDDERYPVHVTIRDAETFTLYFNPADPFLYSYITRLQDLDFPEKIDAGYDEFINEFETIVDSVFGIGSARLISRYAGVRLVVISAIMDKVEEGLEDFEERAKELAKKQQAQAVIDAKKEAAAFVAPQQ